MASRKNNGDGTVYKYNNKWYAEIQNGKKPNGKPNVKKFSAKSEREVKRKLKEFKQQQGKFIKSLNSNKTTVKDYFENWLYDYKIYQLKEQSFDRLESIVNKHIINEIGGYQFAQVTHDDIQNLINKKQKEKYSYSTIKKIYDALNACYTYDYNQGENDRICINNPVYNITINKQKIKNEIFSNWNNGNRKYLYGEAYLLILNTGLRLGEALGLRNNIDLTPKKIYIGQTLITTKNRDKNGKINSDTIRNQTKVIEGAKNKSSNRWIYLNDNAIEYIKYLKNLPRKEYCNALIVNKNGEQVTRQAFIRQFQTILKNAGIKDDKSNRRGVHTLRHTFATNLFKNGVDVKVVSKILGHSSVKITYDTYIHIIESLEIEAMKSIPNI